MKRMRKRCMAVLLSLVMVVSLFVGVPMKAEASTLSMTADEAISWVESKVGQSVGYNDNSGQYQCSELVQGYFEYLQYRTYYNSNAKLGASAFMNASNAPDWIEVIQGATPQKGDILVYGRSTCHVAIYESDYVTYHQNYKYKYS